MPRPEPAPTPHPRSPAATLTGGQVVRIVRKHLALIVACWVSVVTVALFWTLGQTKTYRAEALIRLDPNPPRPLGQKVELVSDTSGSYWNRREFYESEFRIIKSMRVATAVVRTMSLSSDPGFLAVKPRDLAKFKPVSVDDAAQVLLSRLNVDGVRDSSLAYVRYEDSDPARSQTILNTLVRVYLQQNLEQASTVSTSALEWLNSQLDHLKTDLEKSEVALNDFRLKNNVLSVSLEDSHNLLAAQLDQVTRELTSLDIQRSKLNARAVALESLKLEEPLSASATDFLQSSVLSTLRTLYAEQSRQVAELTANLGDQHPKVVQAKASKDVTEKQIAIEVGNIRSAARNDVSEVDRQIGDLKATKERLQKQAHDLQSHETTYNQLARTKTNNEKIYSLVLERTRETELMRVMNFNNIQVVDSATQPKVPVRPNRALNMGLGVTFGLALGVALALLREFGDRSVKTPADVEDLAVPCLGLIPQFQKKPVARLGSRRRRGRISPATVNDRDLIVHAAPLGSVAEAMRVVRTNLTFMSPDNPYKVVLVTSAIPEEGKTSVSCSLATVMAQSGHRVLLIDTDLRRPRLHRTFRLTNDVGVTMAVTKQASIDECIRETDVPNVWVMTSGPLPPNPSEMLQSDRFRELAEALYARFDRVVFDSPPILPVTDATVLSRIVDGVLIVARAFKTDRFAVRSAVRQLQDVNAHVAGIVLNDVDLSRDEYGRYSEYYYQYRRDGYYSVDEHTARLSAEDPAPPAQPDA